MSPSTTPSSNAKTPLAYNPLTKPRNVKLDEGILAFARRARGNNANGNNHSHSTNSQALPCPVLPLPDDSASTELGESLAAAEGLYDEDTWSETEATNRLNSGVDRLKSGILKLSQRIDMLEKVALKDKQIAEGEDNGPEPPGHQLQELHHRLQRRKARFDAKHHSLPAGAHRLPGHTVQDNEILNILASLDLSNGVLAKLVQKNDNLRDEVWRAHNQVQNELFAVWMGKDSEWQEEDKNWSIATRKISAQCDFVNNIEARIEGDGRADQTTDTKCSNEDEEVSGRKLDEEDEDYEFV